MNAILLAPLLCALTWTLTGDSYSPIQAKPETEGVTALEAQWFGKFLARMNEPRLPELTKDPNVEAYRIVILPTWGNPILVRAEKHGTTYALSGHRLDGQAGFELGKLVEAKNLELSAEDSHRLEQLIQSVGLFQLPTDDGVSGFDGDVWFLEGVSQGQYHVIQRWCASSYHAKKRGLTAFLNLCRFLVNKSHLSERPKNRGGELI